MKSDIPKTSCNLAFFQNIKPMWKRFSGLMILVIITATATAQINSKKPLQITDYNVWKEIKNQGISSNAKFVFWEENPLRGDGILKIYDIHSKEVQTFINGEKLEISSNERFLIYRQKVPFDTLRKAKLKKLKDEKLPKDSAIIIDLKNNERYGLAAVKSIKMADKKPWAVVMTEPAIEKKVNDSAQISKKKIKPKKGKDKTSLTDLYIINDAFSREAVAKNVTECEFSFKGDALAYIYHNSDSIDSCFVYHKPFNKKAERILALPGQAQKINLSEDGHQIVFLYSSDTSKIKFYTLYYWNSDFKNAFPLNPRKSVNIPDGWETSANFKPWFSEDGNRIFIGTAPKIKELPKDTLLPEEKAVLDIWSWNDPLIMPQQLKNLEKEKKRSYLAMYDLKKNHLVQLCTETMPDLILPPKGLGQAGLGVSDIDYQQLQSWDGRYADYYYVDLNNGNRKLLLNKYSSGGSLSPDGKYLIYYSGIDSSWNELNTSNLEKRNLTSNLKVSFTDEEHDTPDEANSYGLAGWTNAGEILIYDRFDIWKLKPGEHKEMICITRGFGRENRIRLKYFKTDKDEKWISDSKVFFLKGFNEKTKGSSIYSLLNLKSAAVNLHIHGDFRLSTPIKAENTDHFIFTRETFNAFPDLYLTATSDLTNALRLSDANPQQTDYNWGNVSLYEWTSTSGIKLQGLLYLPENLVDGTPLPCIVYFYEKYSDGLFAYHSPRPTRSTISFSYYASNGYAVFVPDIVYQTGTPGENAFDCIVSGVESLISKGIIDKNHIGIQGQSWGGYQVAYLVTRTNLFKAAMAGAPVSNMTSAYGGIRWGSGMSRMFQYEKTQSRIGATLWENPELYIKNSPLFFAPQINTPLLIMSNDNDGAVPWYQGIELYTAMRRLQKPAWLLNYNNDEHNLKAESWGNRMDLSIRMQQFFDHYLKNAPAPIWMKDGLPAINKGFELRLETE